jgi:DNA-binding MarR family transcriptional regulator
MEQMGTICEFSRSIAVSLSDVVSQPDVGDIELLVLATVAPAGSDTTTLAQRLGKPTETIRAAVSRLVQAGLAETTGDSVTLTRTGRLAAANVRKSWPTTAEGTPVATIDLGEVSRFIGSLWPVDAQRAAAEQAARDELLASDADRDTVVQLLSEAFSQGRLTSGEHEHRTGRALAARTYGELDDVLQGLGGLKRPDRSHPLRKAVFWVVALLSSPFVLVGSMLLAFGVDGGDRVGGVFFLVLLLPGLFALRRWAWPRR